MFHSSTLRGLAAALALSLAPSALAQSAPISESIDASWSRYYGGSVARGYAIAEASTSLESSSYTQFGMEEHVYDVEGSALARGGVRIFGSWRDAFRVEASAEMHDDTGVSQGSNGAIDAFARIGPWTLASYSAEYDLTATRSFGPYNLFGNGITATWWLGPAPVTVRARASCGASTTLALHLNPIEHQARVSPDARGWLNGTMSAGIGLSGFSAGVSSTLRLADTTVGFDLVADLEDGLSGFFTYSMNPIRIYMRLYARVSLWYWNQTWYLTVYSWSANTYGGSRQLL